jgi:hypothetical protein
MAYTIAGCTILFVAALLGGFIDWEIEHNLSHAIIAWYVTGVVMIVGADWVLQRTEWGRKRSAGRLPPIVED